MQPTTYQIIVETIRSGLLNALSLRQACYGGQLPVSYRQAKRVVKRAVAQGDLPLERDTNAQGRPLKVAEK